MDNITHSLTALALSRAGLNRFYTRPALVLVVAANMPDVDISSALSGTVNYVEYHRGLTHSIAFSPVMAIAPVLLAWAISRSRKGLVWAYLLALIGVASHLLLDWTNPYAIRLLLPFSGAWLHADWINVIDIWVWVVLGLAAVGPLLGRLVSAEIGAKPGTGRGLAIMALAFFMVWDFGRYLMHQRAVQLLNSRVYDGAPPIRVGAFPDSLSPVRWLGWADTEHASYRYDMNLLRPFDPEAARKFYKPEPSQAMDAAKRTRPFRVFMDFSQYPLWMTAPADEPEGATRVTLTDERFPFAATALVDRTGRVLSSVLHF